MKQQPSLLDIFLNKKKAILHALWMNFKYRLAEIIFGVINNPRGGYAVCEEATAIEMNLPFLDILPKDLSEMDYSTIRYIKTDAIPLGYWKEITNLYSTTDAEILRYLLHHKVPVEKLIRHELANRGYDESHHYCGLDKAEEIWLK